MKKIDPTNRLQIESFINECKGNLFEFLVAQQLARHYKDEASFLLSLPKNFRNRFQFYEETVRQFDPELLKNLPELASSAVSEILKLERFSRGNKVSFSVIGKMVATNDNETWNETDIVGLETLANGEIKNHFISLKLTKDHSFTNTKSAGIKSFIEKYFGLHGEMAKKAQMALNKEVDESFLVMGHRLYEMVNLEFYGRFDSRWSDQYTELPGELSNEMREVVHANYYRVAAKIRTLLGEMYQERPQEFYQALFALCGYGNKEIIQVQCFHQKGILKDIAIKDFEHLFLDDYSEISLGDLGEGGSSFDIHFKKFMLQLRVKPMNKFTTSAYKVNCSIKMKNFKGKSSNE